MAREVQLPLLPARRMTAAERRALIRERLHGLEVRQQARRERRRQARERLRAVTPDQTRQMTIVDLLER